MRLSTVAAFSALMTAVAVPALAQDAAPAPAAAETPAAQGAPTDQELSRFAAAMTRLRAVSAAVQGGQPTAEQQTEMAGIVQNSGLSVERFNAISAAVSADPLLQARTAVASSTPSAAGSVGASVTDAEAGQFADAMAKVSVIAQALNGAQPTAEQQAEMAAAIQGAGLELERFNAISGAVGQDEHLQARIALARAQAGA